MTKEIDTIKVNLDKSYAITASAGCGKTYALVSRVIALLEKGIPINRMLLLTFSENSALEMKERIIDELKNHREYKWAINALDDIHYSSISTFHSFALEVCRMYPEKIGINHKVSLLDELSKETAQKNFFNKIYNSWGANTLLSQFLTNSYLNGIKRKIWRVFFTNIYENLEFRSDTTSNNLDLEYEIKVYQDSITASLTKISTAAKNVTKDYDTLNFEDLSKTEIDRYTTFNNLSQAMLTSDSTISSFAILNNKAKYIKGRKFESKKKKYFIDSLIELLGDTIDNAFIDIANSTLRLGTKLLVDAAYKFRQESISKGLLTFSDVILGTKKILQNEVDNFEIWQKFDCIIVDEFQDTDPHQLEIIKALSSNASQGDIGRLFVVGDHKQSIYGFRGVDVGKYKNFITTYSLDKIQLDISRRTTKNIIENINQIMGELINDYEEMKHVRDDFQHMKHPHFSTIGYGMDASSADIRRQQGKDIAQKITELIDIDIYDKEINKHRLSTYNDITILIRDRSVLNDILDALQENTIPFSVDSPSLIFEHPFTKFLYIYLKAITRPSDSINIIGALRSPLFNCTNNNLLDFIEFISSNKPDNIHIENYWNINEYLDIDFSNAEKNINKVYNALTELNKLHLEAYRDDLVTFLYKFMFNYGVALGIANANNVNEFELSDLTKIIISKAVSFSNRNERKSIFDFVSQLETERNTSRSNDKITLTSNNNEVHIMTAHGSKGLEFPIVIYVPSIKRENSIQKSSVHILENPELDFSESIALFHNSKFKDSRLTQYLETKNDFGIDEEMRITYVGLTRARDYLVVAKHHKVNKKLVPIKSSASKLSGAIDNVELNISNIDIKSELFQENNKDSNLLNSVLAESPIKSYSSLAKNKVIELKNRIELDRTLSPGGFQDNVQISKTTFSNPRNISLGPAIGRAVHKALYLIDINNYENQLSKICATCSYEEGIYSHKDEIEAKVKKAMQSKLFANMSNNYIREVPISGIISGKRYSGFIDLLIEENDYFNIIDYKTDTIDIHNTLESKVEKYSKQLAIYSILLKQNEHINNTKASFLFLNLESEIVYKIENLDEIEEDIIKNNY